MVVVPKEKPVIENLNSYYLHLEKMLEHCQGEFGSGAVHVKSPSSEGVIFFDQDDLLNGVFENKEGKRIGDEGIKEILEASADHNFIVSIYQIDPERIYFWANIWAAESVLGELSTEFTDLAGLMKKMASEGLTGYIETILDGAEALVFFNQGEIIGGSYSWGQVGLNHTQESLRELVRRSGEIPGRIHVYRISAQKRVAGNRSPVTPETGSPDVVPALAELLAILEGEISSSKQIKQDFQKLLKQKFVEKADKYDFLDPFADEFHYGEKRIRFSGKTGDKELAQGVIECAREMAIETGLLSQLKERLTSWSEKYDGALEGVDLNF